MQTRGALGNLLNRYSAVLKKCHLLNIFGSLAVATMLFFGGAAIVSAAIVGPDADGNVTIGAGDTLDDTALNQGPPAIKTLTNNGNISISKKGLGAGDIINQGSMQLSDVPLNVGNKLTNNGDLTTFAGTFEVNTLENSKNISFKEGDAFISDLTNTATGTLNLTGNRESEDPTNENGNLNVTISKTLANSGTINVKGATLSSNTLANSGTINITNTTNRGTVRVGTFTNSGTITVSGDLEAQRFIHSNTTSIMGCAASVAAPGSAGGQISLNINAGGKIAVNDMPAPQGNITIAEGGVLAHGTDMSGLKTVLANAASFGVNTSGGAYIGTKPLDISGTNFSIGSAPASQAATTGMITLGSRAALIVDQTSLKNSSVFSGVTATNILNDVQVHIQNAKVGDDAVSLFADSAGKVLPFSANDLILTTDNSMITSTLGPDGRLNNRIATVGKALPGLTGELGTLVSNLYAAGLNDPFSDSLGIRFMTRLTHQDYLQNNPSVATRTLESAARMAVVGMAPQMTLAASEAAGTAVTQRTNMSQPQSGILSVDDQGNIIANQNTQKRNLALWIMPLFRSVNGFGMEAGNFDYDYNGKLGGVAIGADYTFDDAIRAGITFNIGGGYGEGSGDLNKTTNNMNFWGVGAYAGWSKNNFGLTADIFYTSTYNKLKQDLPDAMQMDDLKSDITAWAINTGLRAEYKFTTSIMDIIPHIGFRYINLNTDSYDIKSGGNVAEGDSFTQNIWTFPVGVSMTKQFKLSNGWAFKPTLDLNVTPATGDIKAQTSINFCGVPGDAEIKTKTMDYITYGGTAGFEIGNENLKFGLNYAGQFGAESSSHGVFGTFRYEF